jgi:hypothetical protein
VPPDWAALQLSDWRVAGTPAVLASPAQAATQPTPSKIISITHQRVPDSTYTDPPPPSLPGGQFCQDPINVGVVVNNEWENIVTFADGTTLTQVAGPLVLSFTNASPNGKTIFRDESGTTTTIVYPNQTGTERGAGNNVWEFGPLSQINTDEPGLVFTSGPVAITFNLNLSPPQATSFSLHGTQVNGCSLLAAGVLS